MCTIVYYSVLKGMSGIPPTVVDLIMAQRIFRISESRVRETTQLR